MKRIQNNKHKINKISLSCFDDKQFILGDDAHRVVCFHKEISV